MKNREAKQVLLNYNNQPIPAGYTMVPTIPDDLDIAVNVKNPDCIISLPIPGTAMSTRAVLKAVPQSEAGLYRKQYNSWQNDQLGHFTQEGTVSSNAMEDEYDLERGTTEDLADTVIGMDNAVNATEKLINKAPQYAAAMYFRLFGLKGPAFQEAMHIEKSRASKLLQELEKLFTLMIRDGFEAVSVDANTTEHDAYYRKVLQENLDEFLDRIVSYFV